jgi:hydroxyacylglutathione hydrolase
MLFIQSFVFNPFQENTYVIYNEKKEAWLIDPGMYSEAEKMQFDTFIQEQELTPTLLIATHTHLDHVFGIPHVLKIFSIPFCFHEADRPVYDSANNVARMYGVPFDELPSPTFYLKETEKLNLGTDTFDVFLTPGHSPGSICLYHKEQNILISGDVLFQQSIGRSDLPGGDYNTLIRSIHQQLMPLPSETQVYSGHGPVTSIGLEKMNNPFLNE